MIAIDWVTGRSPHEGSMYSQAHVTERCAPLALSRAWLLVIRRAEKVCLGSKEGLLDDILSCQPEHAEAAGGDGGPASLAALLQARYFRDRKGFQPRLRPFLCAPLLARNGRLKEPSALESLYVAFPFKTRPS